jgi:NAD(P)-dependent dehydrogenase (short-subunit alcohol dehydrogenase family)
MDGKFILITGCSSGIGLASALALRERGYRVIASCRMLDDVEALRKQGFEHVLQLDLASSESIQAAIAEVLRITDGAIFALFNNAAYGLPGAVEDLSRAALRRQFETNLFGPHELTCGLLPFMLKQDDARIVQNSSLLGIGAMFNRGAYVASKFALEGLTDALRLELAGTSVKISLIEPGPIVSRFRQNALAQFEQEIDVDKSRHKIMYEQGLARMRKEGPAMRFTLPPSAVVAKLLHALESPHPHPRYYVTLPTYVVGYLKRLLPTRAFDWFLRKAGSA